MLISRSVEVGVDEFAIFQPEIDMSDALRQTGVPKIVISPERFGDYIYLHWPTKKAKSLNDMGFTRLLPILAALSKKLARKLL